MKKENLTQEINKVTFINNFGYSITVIDSDNLLTESIIEELKSYDATFYHNDITCKYWIFDFEIQDVWFEAKDINLCEKSLTLISFK